MMNRDLENVSFSLKLKGAETLTPKECCHGSEAVPSSAGVGFWFSLDETQFSPPVASKSTCAHNSARRH